MRLAIPWALSGLALVCATLVWPATAFSQVADEPPTADIDTLVSGLDDALAALDTSDCAVACQALESMIRSAERICDIDPGEPCTAARAKVEAARQRVLAACPDCAAAAAGAAGKRRHDANEKSGSRPEPVEEKVRVTTEGRDEPSAPPAEDASGGCASCALIGVEDRSIDPAWGLFIGAAALALRRRFSSSSASDRA